MRPAHERPYAAEGLYTDTLYAGHLTLRIPVPHPSAYVSIRQHTSAYVSILQHPSASVSIRQHASAYVSIRIPMPHHLRSWCACQHGLHACASIRQRQHTSAYAHLTHGLHACVSIRPHTSTYAYLTRGLHACPTTTPPIGTVLAGQAWRPRVRYAYADVCGRMRTYW